MKCPNCQSSTWATKTKATEIDEVSRKRKCRSCGLEFKTFEIVDLSDLPGSVLEKIEGVRK